MTVLIDKFGVKCLTIAPTFVCSDKTLFRVFTFKSFGSLALPFYMFD